MQLLRIDRQGYGLARLRVALRREARDDHCSPGSGRVDVGDNAGVFGVRESLEDIATHDGRHINLDVGEHLWAR